MPASAKWTASIVAGAVLTLALFLLEDAYSRVQRREQEHEIRLNAEERTSAVSSLQLTLMQKQLDRIEAKLDAVVTKR